VKREEFEAEEFDFIQAVKSSALYQKIKALSEEIDKDGELKSLSRKRNDLFGKAVNREDGAEKEKIRKEAKQADEALLSSPKRKEYLFYYEKRQKILNHLTAKITEEVLL